MPHLVHMSTLDLTVNMADYTSQHNQLGCNNSLTSFSTFYNQQIYVSQVSSRKCGSWDTLTYSAVWWWVTSPAPWSVSSTVRTGARTCWKPFPPTYPPTLREKKVGRCSSLMTPLNPRRGAGQMLMSGWPHWLSAWAIDPPNRTSDRARAVGWGLFNTYHHIQSSLRLGRVKRLKKKKRKREDGV